MMIQSNKSYLLINKRPVLVNLLDKNFVGDLKRDGTFNEASFDREYESIWAGTTEDAFFSGDAFERNRKLQKPEYEYSGKSNSNAYYIISADVGRKECDTVVCVFKVSPQLQGPAIKTLVNIFVLPEAHFEDQAIFLKRLYYKFKARRVVIDANGLGIGLVDYMVKAQDGEDAEETFPDFGVENDEEGFYKKFETDVTEQDAMYLIKANAPINTESYSTVRTQLAAGKIKFLINEQLAKIKLLSTKLGQSMTPEERGEYLKPYSLTSILKEEMLNLREESEGFNIILKQVNRKIKKDKFSAFQYGIYYIKQLEDRDKIKKKKFKVKDYMFMN